jgi:hypothetical protein
MSSKAFIALIALVLPASLFASEGKQIALRFDQELSSVEQCIVDALVEQTPFEVKDLVIGESLAYGVDHDLRFIKRRIELPVMLVTETNHPALVTLHLVAVMGSEWGKVTTGGRPIFVAPAMESTINVYDATNRTKAYSITHNCGN